jgi:hypothetical protein
MDFRIENNLSHSVEKVFDAYRDRLPELVPFLAEIEKIEVLDRKEEGGKTYITNRWHAKSSTVPAVARPFMPDKALYWIDHAIWDPKARTCEWRYEISVLPGAVQCGGVNYFHEKAGGGSRFEITGKLELDLAKLHVPFFLRGAGPKIEQWLVGRIRPNLEAVGGAVEKWLSQG